MKQIWKTAETSLLQNRVDSQEGPLTLAGGHQFRSFWVRDFCFSVPGLLQLGASKQVRSQLEVCLKYQRQDGLIARGFDVINPKARVLSESLDLTGLVRHSYQKIDYKKRRLKAEFLGEHRTPAADSNILVLLAILQWTENTGDHYFFKIYSKALEKTFRYTLATLDKGLLQQPAFSDWQDSARREGKRFYLNLLFYRVVLRLQKLSVVWASALDLSEMKRLLWKSFFSSEMGLFRDQLAAAGIQEQFSLETQLWCIEEDIFGDFISKEQLWENLKNSPLWKPLPGRPIWPDYPVSEISWTTKFVGLRHYHDGFYWSWLMGESLKVSHLMHDVEAAAKITGELSRLSAQYEVIHEIYELDSELKPVSTLWYKSESPFSWGAAKIIEALSFRKQL